MKSFNKKIENMGFITLMALFFILLIVLPAQAEGGDGTGGGQGESLALVSSSPQNGEKDVPLSVNIKLEFNKNVVNMSVRENNIKCFSFMDDQGKSVPIEVLMADDQMEPERKREVVVVPTEKLKQGSSYSLKIYADFISKSGVTLGQDVIIKFATEGTTEKSAAAEDTKSQSHPLEESTKTALKEPLESEKTAPEETQVTKIQEMKAQETKTKETNAELEPETEKSNDLTPPDGNKEETAPAQTTAEETAQDSSGSRVGLFFLVFIIVAGGAVLGVKLISYRKSC